MKLATIILVNFISFITVNGYSFTKLYCYQCISNHPGCGKPFHWWYYWARSQQCPEEGDKCVKIVERIGAQEIITRDCLSSLRSFRTDIPADHYEGCRPAAKDEKLGHYVNNSIVELDIKRDHYKTVDYCFCYFDNMCNVSSTVQGSLFILSCIAVFHRFF